MATTPFDPSKPKCALCGINLTNDHGPHRDEHERGGRHQENLQAVLAALRPMVAALAQVRGERLAAALAAMKRSVIAMNAAGKNPWNMLRGDFFDGRGGVVDGGGTHGSNEHAGDHVDSSVGVSGAA